MGSEMNIGKGLLGIFLICITMAMMPLAELLSLTPYQLLVVRGVPAIFFGCLFGIFDNKNRMGLPDRYTLLSGITFCLACIGLFNAIRAWGINLSAVLLDMGVLVNFILAIKRGEKLTPLNTGCFVFAIIGSFIAMRGWNTTGISITGLLWSILALSMNGLFVEFNSKATQGSYTKICWWGILLTFTGVLFSINDNVNWSKFPVSIALLFGVATGAINFFGVILAGKNLKPVWMGTLVMAVTPSILLGSWFILKKSLGIDQLFGVLLMLGVSGYLGYQLNKKV